MTLEISIYLLIQRPSKIPFDSAEESGASSGVSLPSEEVDDPISSMSGLR